MLNGLHIAGQAEVTFMNVISGLRFLRAASNKNLQPSLTFFLRALKMRLPYIPDPPPTSSPVEEAIVARIAARRAPRPLIALDLTLLHSPHVADGWNSFLGAIRTQTSLADDVREIAICRVAVVNGAGYEWAAHSPLAEKGGVSKEGLKVLASKDLEGVGTALSAKQLAVARYANAMTKDVTVSDDIFVELKSFFSDQEVVEITATVAAYNCVSRFLVALDVGEHNGVPIS